LDLQIDGVARCRWTDLKKNGEIVGFNGLIIWSNFGFNILRAFRATGGGQNFSSPIDFAADHHNNAAITAQPVMMFQFILLSVFIWAGLTHSEIIAQGILFFLGGFENTANTMSVLAYHLAVNSDCQDRLIQEIDDVIKDQVQLLLCCF